ncbi:flagellar hook protein FlgE [Cryobacterium sp. PH31-O1]|uniref:flagellar hook protein FlgE n=1 Tax=Cryobacterium sp. PH31-O1 TaxID=3046306 RepID=UPI0024B89CB0|nr:flagellar hook protein FlgE [Cryobacterium sp. PH31-O1]MDJ0338886.1 flagellar hook protein FlgE [Cryobacterium sp. PH31-O1]
MLRSLYSGISGLRSHQTMLDVTGNNIANVNTTAFKASAAQFQDTLSQLTQAAGGASTTIGGTNPAQVGLGVQVAGISTNFAQGSSQATGKTTDLMISGDGFFVTSLGGETLYTRAGSFDFDSLGRLVSPDGAIVQGWGAVGGVVADGGAVGNIRLPAEAIVPASASNAATFTGNLPSDSKSGSALVRTVDVYDDLGNSRTISVTFTRTDAPDGWTVADTNVPANSIALVADGTTGNFIASGALTVDGIAMNLAALEGFSGLNTVAGKTDNGNEAGTLNSYTLGADGTLVGLFSNGQQQAIGRIALATFVNPGGLEKAGSSAYRATFNSGGAALGTPGAAGLGSLTSGALEMSNVDLSQEFTNLIVAQRGFQANARIITTSDEVLQELTNLKR